MPTLGPFVALISQRNPTQAIQPSLPLLRWCCIELTDLGFVIDVKAADARVDDLMSPDSSDFVALDLEEMILQVFDPENCSSNHYYSLAITPNRALIRFRRTENTPPIFMLGETYSNPGAWLIKRPLSRSTSFNLNERDVESFICLLEGVDSAPKARFLLQHQARLQLLAENTAQSPRYEDSDWYAQRERLDIDWLDTPQRVQIGAEQEGILADWRGLKRESLTSRDYCLMLIAVIGTPENQASAIHALGSSTDHMDSLQRHLSPNNIKRFHARWLSPTERTRLHLKATHDQLIMPMLYELRRYQTQEPLPLITSFDIDDVHIPSFIQAHDTSSEEAFELASSIHQKMLAPYYLLSAELEDIRQLESDIHAILNERESHWQVKASLMMIDPMPDLNQRLTGWLKELTETRQKRIKMILNLLEVDHTIFPSLFQTTNDLATGLLYANSSTRKIDIIQHTLLDPSSGHFIQTAQDFACILRPLDNAEQRTLVFNARPIDHWLSFIRSAQDLHDFFIHIAVQDKNKVLFALGERRGKLIQSDEDLIMLTRVLNDQKLNDLLSETPPIVLSRLLQTPVSLQALLNLPPIKPFIKKIKVILKAIPDAHRIKALSTPDKFNALCEHTSPSLLSIFLKTIPSRQWEPVLVATPQIWQRARTYLTTRERIATLTHQPKALWLRLMEGEVIGKDIPDETTTDELFTCLLNTANDTIFPPEMPDPEGFERKKPSGSSSPTHQSIHFFQQIPEETRTMDSKRELLMAYCQSSDPTHALQCLKFALRMVSLDQPPDETASANKRARIH